MTQHPKPQTADALDEAGLRALLERGTGSLRGLRLSGRTLQDLTVSNRRIHRSRLDRVRLKNVRFVNCALDASLWTGCTLENCAFDHCSLYGVEWKDTAFANLAADQADLSRARMTGVTWNGGSVRRSSLDLARLENTRFSKIEWDGCLLDEVTADGGELEACRFRDCRITFAEISGTPVVRCRFEDCCFRYTLFSGVSWSETQVLGSDFAFSCGLAPGETAWLAGAGNRMSAAWTSRLAKSRAGRFALPVALGVLAVMTWNFLFNPDWQSTPTLTYLIQKHLSEKRFDKLSGPIQALIRRGGKLPSEILEQITALGMDELAMVLSQGVIRNAVDMDSILLARVIAAELDFKNGHTQEAAAHLQQSLEMAGEAGIRNRILLDLATWSFQTGDEPRCLDLLSQLETQSKDPNVTGAAYGIRGRIRLAHNDPDGAVKAFTQAVETTQDARNRNSLRVELARVEYTLGQVARAVALCGQVVAERDNVPEDSLAQALGMQGQALVAENRLQEAKPLYEQALACAQTPANVNWLQQDLMRLYTDLHLEQPAERLAREIIRANTSPESVAQAKLALARLLNQRQRTPEAVVLYEELFKTPAPLRTQAGLELARLYMDGNKAPQALQLTETLLAETLPPDTHAEILGIRAQALSGQGHKSDAEGLYDKALSLHPNPRIATWITLDLGRLCLDLRRAEKAAALVTPLWEKNDDPDTRAEAGGLLAQGLAAQGRKQEAKALFAKALALASDKGIRNWLALEQARLALELGFLDEARQVCDVVIALDVSPDGVAEALALQAQILHRRGNEKEGTAQYRRAMDLAKDEGLRHWIENELAGIKETP